LGFSDYANALPEGGPTASTDGFFEWEGDITSLGEPSLRSFGLGPCRANDTVFFIDPILRAQVVGLGTHCFALRVE